MPIYQFWILCVDGNLTLDLMKEKMNDFTIYDTKISGYDFLATKDFPSDRKAWIRKKELLKECENILLRLDICGL